MSVFFVKLCLVAISAKQYVRHPFRGSAHLLTDCFEIDAGIAFDDQFIMNMTDDKAVPGNHDRVHFRYYGTVFFPGYRVSKID